MASYSSLSFVELEAELLRRSPSPPRSPCRRVVDELLESASVIVVDRKGFASVHKRVKRKRADIE